LDSSPEADGGTEEENTKMEQEIEKNMQNLKSQEEENITIEISKNKVSGESKVDENKNSENQKPKKKKPMNEKGHYNREYKQRACYNCEKHGHKAKECPEPRKPREILKRRTAEEGSPGLGVCYKCGEKGHYSRECVEEGADKCYNCKEEGHKSKNCKKQKQQIQIQIHPCFNCVKPGHKAKECPEPIAPRKLREELKRRTNDGEAPVLKKKRKERAEYVEKGKCIRCLEIGHSIMECMKEAVCHNCKEVGHKKPECSQPLRKMDYEGGDITRATRRRATGGDIRRVIRGDIRRVTGPLKKMDSKGGNITRATGHLKEMDYKGGDIKRATDSQKDGHQESHRDSQKDGF